MLKKTGIEHIIKSKSATGVEIILLPDGAVEINTLTLKKNKLQFTTEQQILGITELTHLANSIDLKLPVLLVINGKGIIHRKISFSENDTSSSLLNKILPNANINDFYIQQEIIDDSSLFVSVIRKNTVHEIIDELKKNQLTNVTSVSLGPFMINELLPLMDKSIIDNEFLHFKNHQLKIRNDKISEIVLSDPDLTGNLIRIDDEQVQPGALIPFAAALNYFTDTSRGISNSDLLDATKNEYNQKKKYSFFVWVLLIAAFTILIINYFIFNHYWTKNNEMNARLIINQSALKKYESLKSEYTQKKGFLEQNGLLENSQTSYYADQLAASLPSSIQWTNVDIHPLKKKDLNDISERFSFENKVIKIAGKCDRNTELNDWMKAIKKKSWISDVILLNYNQANAIEDGLFLIEIKLK